MSRSLRKS